MKKIVYLFVILFITSDLNAQESIKKELAIADFDYLLKSLDETHPDPYSNFGGRPLFYKTALQYKHELEKDSIISISDFRDLLTSFISRLKDGHTFIRMQQKNSTHDQRYSPIVFKCTPDDIIIKSLPREFDVHKTLLGSKLKEINGISLENVNKEFSKQFISENKYGEMSNISFHCREEYYLNKILRIPHSDTIAYKIITTEGVERDIKLPFITNEQWKKTNWESSENDSIFQIENMSYKFIDDSKQIMYFKLNSIVSRDCIEFIKNRGNNYYETLKYYYDKQNKVIPSDTIKALSDIPSFASNFANMLNVMRKNNTSYLIIDLRGNSGGWTPIVLPSLYEMYGDNYLKANPGMNYYTLISPLYLKKFNITIDQFNNDNKSNFKIGDYRFEFSNNKYNAISNELRERKVSNYMSLDKDLLIKLNGKPIYTPKKVYVITDVYTFSAAYHYAFFLWKMGATIVGVPSCQSPNTYMEVTPLTLPYSKLNASISNSRQLSFPENDLRANILWPDIMLKYDDYKKYKFNDDSELLFLIDKIKNNKVK